MKSSFAFAFLLLTLSSPAAVLVCDEISLRQAVANGGMVTLACDGIIALSEPILVTKDVTISAEEHAVTLPGHEQYARVHRQLKCHA